MVLLSAPLVSVASQPTNQVVQWRRNPGHLLPSRSPQMVSRWCQDGVKMVEKVTQGEEDARTQIGRRGNLWVGSGRRSWWLESYKEVIPN